ncbi:hypothetical protein [Halomarina litorea]|uniref:hypothetical protein n=1 Tax=Halomarina litorea TaxID=2961595 RepID=UPI0020C50077|nr:hypothetical protein [Halomarina sp. BCD28]
MSNSDFSNVPESTDTGANVERQQRDEAAQTPDHINGSGGDNDLVSLEQTTIQRDEDGEIIPRREYVEELGGDGIARPLTGALRSRYIEGKLEAGEDLTDRDLANIFDRCVVAPDLTTHPQCPSEGVTESFVSDQMTGAMQDAYFILVLLASDEDAVVERIRATSRGDLPPEAMQLLEANPEAVVQFAEQADEDES